MKTDRSAAETPDPAGRSKRIGMCYGEECRPCAAEAVTQEIAAINLRSTLPSPIRARNSEFSLTFSPFATSIMLLLLWGVHRSFPYLYLGMS